ncbi:17933_t:CDS:2 [Gigaspora rosea]|nr:17933_t:CDS:2 [Gigaspora rosea]
MNFFNSDGQLKDCAHRDSSLDDYNLTRPFLCHRYGSEVVDAT